MLRRVIASAVVALILSGTAVAGAWEDGWEAYDRGEYATALRLWRPLAEKGFIAVQMNVGSMYASGLGVQKDHAVAAAWYRRAAEQGYALAQFNLGVMYDKGQGVPQNDIEAVRWYRRAAEQGFADAQFNLAFMYGNGRGVTQDFIEAYVWFSLAAAQGDEDAATNRDLTADLMTAEQVEAAERMVEDWRPEPSG